jgi:hypothetical protein
MGITYGQAQYDKTWAALRHIHPMPDKDPKNIENIEFRYITD